MLATVEGYTSFRMFVTSAKPRTTGRKAAVQSLGWGLFNIYKEINIISQEISLPLRKISSPSTCLNLDILT